MVSSNDLQKGTNAERSRSHNRRVVLGRVRSAGEVGRAEIARSTGLTTQAVSNIIADLKSEGYLRETGRRSVGRGLPAVQYALDAGGAYALGVEIRPDALFLALLDLTGREVVGQRESLSDAAPHQVATRIVAFQQAVLRNHGFAKDRLLGAGIVLPGPFGTAAISDAASELPDWQNLNVAAWMSDKLNLPVLVEKDANAAAMAERVSGVAKDLENFAFLYFGAGLGLGLVQGGRLMRGGFGNAGEIGHIVVATPDGPVELENIVSRVAAQTSLTQAGINATTSADLASLFAARDPTLLRWLDATIPPLSQAVFLIENLFDPQTIVLGGAMPREIMDHMIARVQPSDRSVSNRIDRASPRLATGGSGRMTAARGAAALVINQCFTSQITANP